MPEISTWTAPGEPPVVASSGASVDEALDSHPVVDLSSSEEVDAAIEQGHFRTETRLPQEHTETHLLSFLPLVAIIFYSVSGGPFGIEESIRSAGAFYSILGFAVMPFVWSVQEASVTAELTSAFPEAAGGVVWVEEAFGKAAGWMSGYLNWIGGATDNAIYPVLFLDYLLQVVSGDGRFNHLNAISRFLLLSTMSVSLAYINWLGLDVVGNVSIGICILSMSPFIVLVVVGAFQVDPQLWFRMPTPVSDYEEEDSGGLLPNLTWRGVLWRPFLNNLFWNLNSFDSASSFGGNVEDPGRVLPRAMFWSVIMVAVGYLLPLLVVMGASDAPQEAWVDGYLAKAASQIVGPWLGAWTVFASAISNIALFQAELSSDAFQLMGMADRGFLPEIFRTRSRHGTPTYGILLGTVVIVLMGVSDLDRLIEMLNFNYAISVIMEYAAFLKLRISKPEVHRPYRVPLNTAGCVLFVLPPVTATLLVMALASYETYAFGIVVNLIGIFIYLASVSSDRRLCKYYTPLQQEAPLAS